MSTRVYILSKNKVPCPLRSKRFNVQCFRKICQGNVAKIKKAL